MWYKPMHNTKTKDAQGSNALSHILPLIQYHRGPRTGKDYNIEPFSMPLPVLEAFLIKDVVEHTWPTGSLKKAL